MRRTTALLLSTLAFTWLAFQTPTRAQTTPGFDVLRAFNVNAGEPLAIILASDHNFYGVTALGGSQNLGMIFKMGPAGGLTVLHSFTGPDGEYPQGAFVQGGDGNFYGTTYRGGSNDTGTIFQMTPAGVFTIIHTFGTIGRNQVNNAGAFPEAIAFGHDGNLYGAAYAGGSGGSGTLFRLTPSGAFTLLHSFSAVNGDGFNDDGAEPNTLVQGSDGDFYGATKVGGNAGGPPRTGFGCGTLFKMTSDGEFSTLHRFTYDDDGDMPAGPLVQGSDGNFYGTTQNGGSWNGGTVFRLTPSGILATVYMFGYDRPGGAQPGTGLIRGSDGNFYGATLANTIFRMTPDGTVTTIYTFDPMDQHGCNHDGAYPVAPLVEGRDGNLYGTAATGGANGAGTLFRVDVRLYSEQFTASTYQVAETAGTVTLQVSRSAGSTGAASVRYATADGTAEAGRDYTAASGRISWAEGDTGVKSIVVRLLDPGEEYPGAQRQFTVSLSNPGGTGTIGATGTATVILLGTTSSPVITSPATAGATQGNAFSYQITASNDPMSYGVQGLPPGLSVAAKTGLISGTPTTSGTKTLTLHAYNSKGTGQKTLTLTIAAP